MITILALQSSTHTFIHNAILFIGASTLLDTTSSFVNWEAKFGDNFFQWFNSINLGELTNRIDGLSKHATLMNSLQKLCSCFSKALITSNCRKTDVNSRMDYCK